MRRARRKGGVAEGSWLGGGHTAPDADARGRFQPPVLSPIANPSKVRENRVRGRRDADGLLEDVRLRVAARCAPSRVCARKEYCGRVFMCFWKCSGVVMLGRLDVSTERCGDG